MFEKTLQLRFHCNAVYVNVQKGSQFLMVPIVCQLNNFNCSKQCSENDQFLYQFPLFRFWQITFDTYRKSLQTGQNVIVHILTCLCSNSSVVYMHCVAMKSQLQSFLKHFFDDFQELFKLLAQQCVIYQNIQQDLQFFYKSIIFLASKSN